MPIIKIHKVNFIIKIENYFQVYTKNFESNAIR